MFHQKQKNILKEPNYVLQFECQKEEINEVLDSKIKLVEDCLNKSAKSWIEDTSDMKAEYKKIGYKRINTCVYTPVNKKK